MPGDHIAFAYALAGARRGRALDDDEAIARALRADAPAWLHLQADHPEADAWIDAHMSYLDPSIRDALTEPQTRPRTLTTGNGILVFLRAINLNEGADPEDMVSLRLYVDPARVVSLSRRGVRTVEMLAAAVGAGSGPIRTGALLADLVEHTTDGIEAQIADLEDRAEAVEAATIADPMGGNRSEVSDQRLELTELRRFLTPQREAVREILRARVDWLRDGDRAKIGEQADQLTRVTESLEALREQLQTIRDEIESARADRLNRNLYVLSVISAVFLPLGFLTGLMGINLAGMPGATWAPAFWIFSAALVAVAGLVLALLRVARIL